MLYTDLSYQLPAHRSINTINGIKYVYQILSSHRDPNTHKLHHKKALVGRLGVDEKQSVSFLIPNDKYFEINGLKAPEGTCVRGAGRVKANKHEVVTTSALKEGTTLGFGLGIACLSIAKECGLWQSLNDTFGEQDALKLLTLASFYLTGHRGLTELKYFSSTQMSFCNTILSGQEASKIFANITSSSRQEFFHHWLKQFERIDDSICYDVTSISTYSDGTPERSFGYNRDHEDLRQINLGLFARSSNGCPLFYTHYNGCINDFTNFDFVLSEVMNVGLPKHFLLVMDGGFASGDGIDFATLKGCKVLVGAPVDHCPRVRDALLKWRLNGGSSPLIHDFDEVIECTECEFTLQHTKGRLLLYRADVTAMSERATLVSKIKQLEHQLEVADKSKVLRGEKQFSSFFKIIKNEGTTEWSYTVDDLKVKEELSLCGCFALFTTKQNLTIEKALSLYRSKDHCEKAFDNIKNEMIGGRLFCHSQQATDGKLFAVFLGLILRVQLRNKLHAWIKQHRLSLDVAIRMLEDVICQKRGDRWLLIKAFTKQQKEIIKLLNMHVDFLAEKQK